MIEMAPRHASPLFEAHVGRTAGIPLRGGRLGFVQILFASPFNLSAPVSGNGGTGPGLFRLDPPLP